MSRMLTLGLMVLALFALALPAHAAHGRGDLTVGLNGAKEVGTDGDPNGSGRIDLAFFAAVDNPEVVFPGEAYVCYDLTTRNIDDDLTGLHIHEVEDDTNNPRMENGPVVVDLLAGEQRVDADGNTCVVVDEDVLDGILEDPDEYYVNAHNEDFPAGAIRGQLHAFS